MFLYYLQKRHNACLDFFRDFVPQLIFISHSQL